VKYFNRKGANLSRSCMYVLGLVNQTQRIAKEAVNIPSRPRSIKSNSCCCRVLIVSRIWRCCRATGYLEVDPPREHHLLHLTFTSTASFFQKIRTITDGNPLFLPELKSITLYLWVHKTVVRPWTLTNF